MKRIVIAPGAASAALGVLMFFAAGALLIGVLMLIGAENIAKNSGKSATPIRIGAVVFAAGGAAVMWWAVRQWSAITAIEVGGDGWTLFTRRGRRVAVRGPVDLWLRCRRLVYMLGAMPHMQDIVDGTLEAGGQRYRLAPSGPFTYGQVLAQLGISAAPPARGQDVRYSTTA